MEWVEIRRARRRDQERQREAEIRAEGEAKVINALQKARQEGIPLEKALEEYESKNGKKV